MRLNPLLQGRRALGAAAALVLLAPAAARAAELPAPENVVRFSATASLEVTKDWLTVQLQAVREGAEATEVQKQIRQVLDSALVQARRSAQPGALEVRTGQFTINPRYDRNGRIGGWQGVAELALEGRDAALVAQTAGRLQGLNITGSAYSLSRELREKHEAEIAAQAIQKYRARAADFARQFGFASYVLREVNVTAHDAGHPPPMPMAAMARARSIESADAALPVEPGKGVLSATVEGSVQLLK